MHCLHNGDETYCTKNVVLYYSGQVMRFLTPVITQHDKQSWYCNDSEVYIQVCWGFFVVVAVFATTVGCCVW